MTPGSNCQSDGYMYQLYAKPTGPGEETSGRRQPVDNGSPYVRKYVPAATDIRPLEQTMYIPVIPTKPGGEREVTFPMTPRTLGQPDVTTACCVPVLPCQPGYKNLTTNIKPTAAEVCQHSNYCGGNSGLNENLNHCPCKNDGVLRCCKGGQVAPPNNLPGDAFVGLPDTFPNVEMRRDLPQGPRQYDMSQGPRQYDMSQGPRQYDMSQGPRQYDVSRTQAPQGESRQYPQPSGRQGCPLMQGGQGGQGFLGGQGFQGGQGGQGFQGGQGDMQGQPMRDIQQQDRNGSAGECSGITTYKYTDQQSRAAKGRMETYNERHQRLTTMFGSHGSCMLPRPKPKRYFNHTVNITEQGNGFHWKFPKNSNSLCYSMERKPCEETGQGPLS